MKEAERSEMYFLDVDDLLNNLLDTFENFCRLTYLKYNNDILTKEQHKLTRKKFRK